MLTNSVNIDYLIVDQFSQYLKGGHWALAIGSWPLALGLWLKPGASHRMAAT